MVAAAGRSDHRLETVGAAAAVQSGHRLETVAAAAGRSGRSRQVTARIEVTPCLGHFHLDKMWIVEVEHSAVVGIVGSKGIARQDMLVEH